MQDPKETLNNIDHNTEMALLQSEKIAESVDNLEPIMEGVLVKADDILNEQKKTNELLSKEEEPKPEVQKIELLGAELITIKGKDGENGDKGEKGDKGDTGERGEKGEQGERGDIGKQGEKGEKGDNGDTGKDGIDGLDGKDGKNGKNGKDGSPDTPKQVKEKLLKVGLDYNEIDNTPDINKVINIAVAGVKQSSKTVSLVELDDIDYSGLSIVDGKYVLGGGTGGGTWGSITGTLSNQTDLQNALNAKQDTITTGTTAQYFRGDLSLATFPTLVSSFTNDSGFITSSALSPYLPLTGAIYATTTGNGLSLTTSTLTTGSLVSLSSTGTGAGSNTQTVLNIATSGANGTSSQTTYGAYVTNTHTGTTSTNVGLYVSASGATNNYGLIVANGNVGIGQTSPTARLHIAAGTASAGTSPLKFTSGTNLTTPEAGAMEYDGTSLYFSPSTTRRTVVLDTATQTLTNKRINPRVQAVTSASTVTPSADNDDEVVITAQGAALTLANWSGTPVQGQAIIIRIKDDGTARAITFDTLYRAVGAYLPTTTVIGKTVYIACIYNSTDTKIDVVSVAQEI